MSIITGLKSVRTRIGKGKAAAAEGQLPEKLDSPTELDTAALVISPLVSAATMPDQNLALPTSQLIPEQDPVAEAVNALTSPETTKRRSRSQKASAPGPATKAEQVLSLLHRAEGTTLAEVMNATGWQAHSVRGFLSATVRKKLGLDLISKTDDAGTRRYRIASAGDDTGEGSESSGSVDEVQASAPSDNVANVAPVN